MTSVLLRDRAFDLQLDGAESVILALARAVEARDLYTVHHAERVGRFAVDVFAALLERGAIDTLTRQQLTGETGEGQPPVVSGGTL